MITKHLVEALSEQNVTLSRFQEITTRLFAFGVISRDEAALEQRMYDEARRIESALQETFSVFGFKLVHDVKYQFFRLYTPGAQIPGMIEADLEPVPSLRTKLSSDFVAAALALRFLYQQAILNGASTLTDKDEVLIRFEELAATLQTQVKRPLPESPTERKQLLAELKRHRIIQVSSTFTIENEDAYIAIRPTILGIISEESLLAAISEKGGLAKAEDTCIQNSVDDIASEQTDEEEVTV